VITQFINRLQNNLPPIINGDGLQCRDFIFISDVLEANLLSMNSKVDGAFYNVGTGKCTAIIDLSKILITLSGKKLEPLFQNPYLEIYNSVKQILN